MIQLSDFLSPIPKSVLDNLTGISPKSLIHSIPVYTADFPDLSTIQIAIIGVKEDRFQATHANCFKTPDDVRKQFYTLIKPKYDLNIADLGNIEPGNTVGDTLFALQACLKELHQRKIFTIIIGGSSDLSFAQFASFQNINPNLNILVADSKIDLKQNDSMPEYSNFLYKIITHQPNYLFNITHVGNQAYYAEQESLDTFDNMNFDVFRLGQIRSDIKEFEPLARNANMMVFSMNSIKSADVVCSIEMNPNGFYGEEACQMVRYAGMGNDLSSIGFYDLNTTNDVHNCGSKLLAQMIWYLIDGFYNRKNDYPTPESNDYMIYRTTFKNNDYEIVFYKNIYNERWWMEVPYPKERNKQKGSYIVPCSYNDYQLALKDEIPDRWMRAYQKLLV